MNRDMRDIGLESVGFTQIGGKRVSNSGGNGLHAPAKVAHEVDVHVLVDRVIRRRSVTDVGMRDKPNIFQHLERAIDRREVDPAGGVLHLDEDLLGCAVPQCLDRFQRLLLVRSIAWPIHGSATAPARVPIR